MSVVGDDMHGFRQLQRPELANCDSHLLAAQSRRVKPVILAYLDERAGVPTALLDATETSLPYARRIVLPASACQRRTSLIGLSLARELTRDCNSLPGTPWHFTSNGRPSIVGASAFSISHTRDLVACAAFRSGAIGLDVEHCDDVQLDRLKLALSAGDLAAIDEDDHDAAAVAWTRKEASLKCAGLGLRDLHNIPVAARASVSFRLLGGYVASIVCESATQEIVLRVVDGASLLRAAVLGGRQA